MGDGRGRSALWRRCRRIVERLDLPRPFDVREFVGLLALERGRPIELIQVSARPNLPCGLTVSTDDADLILYSADTSALHRQHILLHEAAHLVCGHGDGAFAGGAAGAVTGVGATAAASAAASADTVAGPAEIETAGPFGAIEALLPHLPAELVHRVLGRTVYSEPQEREAELVASLILYRVGRDDGPRPRPPRPPSRLEAVFGLSEF